MRRDAPASLSIAALAARTGVSAHVIRAWERRYHALAPERALGGRRLYGQADVERLSTLRRLVEAGHAIGVVARLDDAELSRLAPTPAATPSELAAAVLSAAVSHGPADAARQLAIAARACEPIELMEDVLAPLLTDVGARWARGELTIADERAVSTAVRAHLVAVLRAAPQRAEAPAALATTLGGELHDVGALFAAVTASTCGWRAVFLAGPLPAVEVARAAKRLGTRAVMLAFAHGGASAETELRALRRTLPQPARVLVGGPASSEVRVPRGVERCGSLRELARTLK